MFICMLMITAVVPLSATPSLEKTTRSMKMDDALYVGGSGPNNYTTIQDAIDNATDGDIVYVFDDSSPYYENIVVGKSITLQGENKDTTIIDGSNRSHGVDITADYVTVTGFTIQHCHNNEKLNTTSGILLSSSNNTIKDTILLQNLYGISNIRNYSLPLRTGFNNITENQFINNTGGVYFVNESNNAISKNIFSQSGVGIMLMGALNTVVSFNTLTENGGGIMMIYTSNTLIYRNNLTYNKGGLATVDTNADHILQNNFIGNTKHNAVSSQQFVYKNLFMSVYYHTQFQRNVWDENYWDGPRMFPYIIFGVFKLHFNIDWHPAQEPYDLP